MPVMRSTSAKYYQYACPPAQDSGNTPEVTFCFFSNILACFEELANRTVEAFYLEIVS